MTESRRRRRGWLIASAATVAALATLAVLVWSGILWPGRMFAAGYETRGVDVSSYQGEIDWQVLASEGIDFAYIKSTEGSSYVDERFEANWAGANETELLVGAYHFMSFESAGQSQAEHVIDTVPRGADLAIAVDVEFYGDFFADPPSRADVDAILRPLLERLQAHYGSPPVIYATPEAYDRYIAGAYPDNPIWIRSVVLPPTLEDERDWTIWQYSHRDRLAGYEGDEAYIDMNVFRGSTAELAALAGE
ncbi:GH25 family lysozyme [Microbacterium paludicola]|uniref:GH25 family lysozyme n=1 Tax=Microbacterium paludicola TaxID=300019 RepID=UPI0031D573F6